jgi:hypothetical protein
MREKHAPLPPEAFAIRIHDPVQGFYHNLVLVQILLEFVNLGGNGALLVAHRVKSLDDLLLRLFVLHRYLLE